MSHKRPPAALLRFPFLWLPALIMLALGPGCAQSTIIATEPGGVAVTLEGGEVGNTDTHGTLTIVRPWLINEAFPRQYTITLSKPGYKPRKELLQSRYHLDISLLWLLAGIAPYFFTARMDATYPRFTMEPDVPDGPVGPDVGGDSGLGGPDLD